MDGLSDAIKEIERILYEMDKIKPSANMFAARYDVFDCLYEQWINTDEPQKFIRSQAENTKLQEFDWSQAKPGMAFMVEDDYVLNFYLCGDPYDENCVATYNEDFMIKWVNKRYMRRVPERDVDWSHIH